MTTIKRRVRDSLQKRRRKLMGDISPYEIPDMSGLFRPAWPGRVWKERMNDGFEYDLVPAKTETYPQKEGVTPKVNQSYDTGKDFALKGIRPLAPQTVKKYKLKRQVLVACAAAVLLGIIGARVLFLPFGEPERSVMFEKVSGKGAVSTIVDHVPAAP